jgi:hypothetical protein
VIATPAATRIHPKPPAIPARIEIPGSILQALIKIPLKKDNPAPSHSPNDGCQRPVAVL